jgi:hypothetical protein
LELIMFFAITCFGHLHSWKCANMQQLSRESVPIHERNVYKVQQSYVTKDSYMGLKKNLLKTHNKATKNITIHVYKLVPWQGSSFDHHQYVFSF